MAAVEDPDSKTQAALSVTLQELSINGTPVVNTTLHEYVDTIHKRMLAAQRRKGHTPQPPSYLLHLTISPNEVTFTGPALHRSALIPMSHGVQQLLASVLMQAWGKAMPAAVVGDIQATIERSLPPSVPSHHMNAKQLPHPSTHDADNKGMHCTPDPLMCCASSDVLVHGFLSILSMQDKQRQVQHKGRRMHNMDPMDVL